MDLTQPRYRVIAIPLDAFPGATAAWSTWRYADHTYSRVGELARLSPFSWVARIDGALHPIRAQGRAAAILAAFGA